MIFATLPEAGLRRCTARTGSVLFALGCTGPAFGFAPSDSAGAGPSLALVLALILALIGLVATIAAGFWLRKTHDRVQHLQDELQQARAEAHSLGDALDVWQWRTDAQHRLTHLRPPPGVPAAVWSSGQAPAPLLWEHFQARDADMQTLRNAAQICAPLPLTAVWQTSPAGHRRQLLLRGSVVLDADGRFAGHLGTARDNAQEADAALAELLRELPMPVLRIRPSRPGAPTSVQDSNPAVANWLGINEAQRAKLGWLDLLTRVPPDLRPVLEQVPQQAAASLPLEAPPQGGWSLHVQRWPQTVPGAPHEKENRDLLMVFQRAPAESASAVADYRDQESFIYTVSHDLRAPLRVVEGFTKIVKEDYGRMLDRIGNDHLDRVLSASVRMNNMIDSLLALSRLSAQPLARQPVNLSQLVTYIVDDLRRQSPERDVKVMIEPGLQAHGDATLLRVALENLLGNAWKYTGKSASPCIWFESSQHDGHPAFTVRDNGAGFDMRFADRLFGVFQRLHSASEFQGTGIGLASVRRIVRRHGGDIWAEGEMDRGARFQFWLPEPPSR
jgi:signal transduction histidine kinase